MFKDTSRLAVLPAADSASFAKPGSSVGLVLSGLCVVIYWAIFLWASGRGYDFSDEAYDLVVISNPFPYVDTTSFSQIWHPLYVALGGSFSWFRIAGLAVLSACGALFGFSVWRFTGDRGSDSFGCASAVLATTASVAWQYEAWKATPDYNMLDFCAVLLFFSGLLCSVPRPIPSGARVDSVPVAAGSAVLCGVGICLMVLVKATTAPVALILGLLWVAVLRPQRVLIFLTLGVLVTSVLLGAAMIAMDGSIPAFLANKFRAFEILKASSSSVGDVHGIRSAIFDVFYKETWKLAQTFAFAAVPLALGLAWSWSLTSPRGRSKTNWPAIVISILLAAILAWWRLGDMQDGQEFTGSRIWRLFPLLVLCALAFRVLWMTGFRAGAQGRRAVFAAGLLALAPVAYAFGSNVLLVWKISEAGIFWVGSMLIMASLTPTFFRGKLIAAVALLGCLTAIGLVSGTMIAPGRIGAPVWKQATAVRVGARSNSVEVTAAAADYVKAFQRAAAANGFTTGTPVIDLSDMGLGLTFALGGKALGSPPWLIANGGLPTVAERLADVKVHARAAPAQLADVSGAELRQAWVITGSPVYVDIVKTVLISRGLDFPGRYRVVSRNNRSDLGWTQTLWKPRD